MNKQKTDQQYTGLKNVKKLIQLDNFSNLWLQIRTVQS